ncbi:MAG: PDZ domain-containing protein [Planctomycetes bacterium]|nr:PDZ domain-containing protein [Planctomycetota bacterium]
MRILWTAKIGLLVVLLYAGFHVATRRLHVGDFLDPSAASGDLRPREESAPSANSFVPSDYTTIAQRNLFTGPDNAGGVRAGTTASESLDTLLSAEALGLRLVGAVAGGPTASRALIQDAKTNATGVYRIGDTVAAATVETIRRDAVVLRHHGEPVVLKLSSGTATPGKTAPAPDRQPNGTVPAAGTVPANNAPRPDRAGYVAEIFRQVTIEPYVKNDHAEGLRITGLEAVPMAEKLGLRNGDIIQTVNGQKLTSKQRAFQVLMKAKTLPRIDIQLLRDGKSKGLSFDL